MAVLSPVQRLVSNGTSVFIAADRTAAVAAAISGSGTLATVVPRYVAWPGLERLTNDNNSFFAPFGEPQCIWDTTATDGQTRGFATASNPFTLTGTSELAVSLAAFADNALEAQIDLVDAATSAIVSAPPLGVLLTDGSMDPASGTTTDINPPFNWQNIRFYSVNSGAIPAGTYKVVVSFRGVNYNRASGTVNPAALAFVADVYSGRSSLAPFSGGLEVLEKTAVFNLQPVYGLSALRDVASTTGSGTAANAGDGYMLVTTNDGTDSATLDSAERGRYEPGYASQAGIGVQLPVPPAGNQVARWGYFDDQNGAFWGRDVTNGIFVAVRRLGVDTIIPQSAWNVDKLDGTGPSGFVLDLAAGNIFEIDFTWYGFGVAEFSVLIRDPASGVQKKAAAHRFMPAGQTSFVDPNLPVRAQIQNNGTASAFSLFVTGRQYSIIGKYVPQYRITAERTQPLNVMATPVPAISFRRKPVFPAGSGRVNSVRVMVEGADLIVYSEYIYYQLVLGGALDGAFADYPTPTTDIPAPETALQVNTTATAISGGQVIYEGLSTGGTIAFTTDDIQKLVIPGDTTPITLVLGTYSPITTSAVAVLRMREEW